MGLKKLYLYVGVVPMCQCCHLKFFSLGDFNVKKILQREERTRAWTPKKKKTCAVDLTFEIVFPTGSDV